MKSIYLDHAATTPLLSNVLSEMLPFLTEVYGNPSSVHRFGREARLALDQARAQMAHMLACKPSQLIWTSGGTESDNLAIFGALMGSKAKLETRRHVITSQIEHHAVLHSCQQLEHMGFDVTYLPVDANGLINVADIERVARKETSLISIQYGNNEMGTIQPIRQIGEFARKLGILFHVDAVQALGTIAIDLAQLPVDFMSFSAHKIGGPKGIGALYCADNVVLTPQIYGGAQEHNRRAGTENVAGAVGFAAAMRAGAANRNNKYAHVLQLRRLMIDTLSTQLKPSEYVINGHPTETLPHILNVSFPGISTETMLIHLDLKGIAASSGSACSSGSLSVSHVLKAMRLPDEISASAIRFSFNMSNTADEIRETVSRIVMILHRLRN